MHIRDEKGKSLHDAQSVLRALDLALDECPDILLSHSSHIDGTKKGAEMLKPLVDPLLDMGQKRGREYIHTVVIAPYPRHYEMDEDLLKDCVTYLESNGIRPEFQIHNYACIHNVQDWLLKDSTLKGPCIMNLISGYHGSGFSGPTSLDLWSRVYFMSLMSMLPKGSIVGATIGGHSWLPLIVEAITFGVDCVRIGMEDTIWMYPHKDAKIKNCAEVIKKVATITRDLDREIATPRETKELFGLKLS